MNYFVMFTVIDSEKRTPIKGAQIYDSMSPVQSTDVHGVWNFEVNLPDDAPDCLPDNVVISANNYTPQYLQVDCTTSAITVPLVAYPQQIVPNPSNPPTVFVTDNQPATLTEPGWIKVSWVSGPYDKFLIWWTVNGASLAQGEVDMQGAPGTSGTWKTNQPIIPGAIYTFKMEGGTSEGAFGGYNYSGWGNQVTVTAVQNFRSLVRFLQHSELNPNGLHVSSIMGGDTHLRRIMKLQ